MAMSSGNARPLQCALRPTKLVGCMTKASCHAWAPTPWSSCCGGVSCGAQACWNVSGARAPWRRQEPGWALRHCRTRSTWGGPRKEARLLGGGPPTALAGRVARLAARGRGAGAWPPRAARVGSKAGLTVLALACGEWTSHGPVSPQAHARKIVAWQEANREEKTGRRRSKQTEEGDKYHRWMGRRRTGLNDHFNRTVSLQFLIAADKWVAKACRNSYSAPRKLRLSTFFLMAFLPHRGHNHRRIEAS